MTPYFNPYSGADFFSFFLVFAKRMYAMLTGQIGLADLASDEIQLLTVSLVAASCALVGSFLVLRRMSMLANALSHTVLLGIMGSYLFTMHAAAFPSNLGGIDFQNMLLAAILSALLTTLLTTFFHKVMHLTEDASIGLVFTSLFALGILLVSFFTRSAHIGAEVVMGNADALHRDDIRLAAWILAGDALFFILFFKEMRITTFDPAFSQAVGISPSLFDYFLMLLLSLTTVAAFRAVGVILVLTLLVAPCLSARLLTHRLIKLVVLACLFGVASASFGVALSRHMLSVYNLPLSTAGLVVCCNVAIFVGALIVKGRLTFSKSGIYSPYKEKKEI